MANIRLNERIFHNSYKKSFIIHTKIVRISVNTPLNGKMTIICDHTYFILKNLYFCEKCSYLSKYEFEIFVMKKGIYLRSLTFHTSKSQSFISP